MVLYLVLTVGVGLAITLAIFNIQVVHGDEWRALGERRASERADPHGASGDAQGELCSPPLHSRRGKTTDEAEKGRTQARSMWSERRCPLMIERSEGGWK